MQLQKLPRTSTRRGFSLLELLVVISIMAVLLSLILPAVQNARRASRKVQCANNMRNVSIGMLNLIDSRGRYPAAAYWGGTDKRHPGPHHNWVVQILPWIDRVDLADRWDLELLSTAPANQAIARTQVAILACPSDDSVSGQGDLSYVLNGGIGESDFRNGVHDCIVGPFGASLDLNGNGLAGLPLDAPEGNPTDREIYKRVCLFFNENWMFTGTPGYQGTSRYHRTATVTDGLSQTLLLTENIKTGAGPDSNWASCDSRRTKVYFSSEVCRNNTCSMSNVDLAKANSPMRGINKGLAELEGNAPWPSSHHSAGVNAAYADGSVRFLSEDIDGAVYFKLFAPQDSKLYGTSFR